jgi:hypothetical protein
MIHGDAGRRPDIACEAELRRGSGTIREHSQDGVVVGARARLHDGGNATVKLEMQ